MTSFIQAIHHLRKSYEYFQDVCRTAAPSSKRLINNYCSRLEWVANDLITHTDFPSVVRDGLRAEWQNDVFAPDAINEKFLLLNPQQREIIENICDCMLKGEEISVVNAR